ncbi:ATP-binding cassette domain-containing protein, partial [Acinetobacter baumannii]|uniref:ATP-binding cassette domain-containing protein n=1 Tax=Acinetobacter baumannii TaxID=470 RepID=UPI0013D71671
MPAAIPRFADQSAPVQGRVTRVGLSRFRSYAAAQIAPDAALVGLIGPNGAGKTTTFGMIAGLVVPDAGIVTLDGVDMTRFPLFTRARLGLGY